MRNRIRTGFIAAAVLAASVGCGREKPVPKKVESKAPPEYFRVDPSNAGTVRGRIRFDGKHPGTKRISMDAEEACEALHKTPVFDEKILVGKSGGLANVFVYVKSGLEGKSFAPVQEAVVLEQRGCQFVPRVIALRSGQTLAVRNSDPVSHNVHPMPQNNRDWNQQQAPGAPDLQRRFSRPEVMIAVKCNVHAWMRAYIGVLDHPYYAVTDPSGEFELPGLPAGEYTIAAWHEVLGETTRKVTVRKGESEAVEFRLR